MKARAYAGLARAAHGAGYWPPNERENRNGTESIMYVVFEQRERGQQGSSFVDSAWDRFYRDLDVLLCPPGLAGQLIGASSGDDPEPGDDTGDGEYGMGCDGELATMSLEQSGAA